MPSPLDSELIFVTGKGGVGKTTVAAALGLLAAERGLRTIVVEVGQQTRLPAMLGDGPHAGGRADAGAHGAETALRAGLWSISIDPDRALMEWLQALGGRVSGRLLGSSATFNYFAAAAPGAREMVSMVKIWELSQQRRWQRHARDYDLVIVDAPATGHALGLLESPRTFGAIARVGPVAAQAQRLRELLEDRARTSYVGVALATEMAVSEALELQQGLGRALGRELAAVIVNGLLPQRFNAEELERLDALADGDGGGRRGGGEEPLPPELARSAVAAAHAVHARARFQHNQLARLRRRERDFDVLGLPFLWTAAVELPALERLAARLARNM